MSAHRLLDGTAAVLVAGCVVLHGRLMFLRPGLGHGLMLALSLACLAGMILPWRDRGVMWMWMSLSATGMLVLHLLGSSAPAPQGHASHATVPTSSGVQMLLGADLALGVLVLELLLSLAVQVAIGVRRCRSDRVTGA